MGSAKQGLQARVARHRRRDKRVHWHVDYLLSRAEFRVIEVWVSDSRPECHLARTMLSVPAISIPKSKLGASDCLCPAHFLAYSGELSALHQYLQDLGLVLYTDSKGY